MFKHIRETTKQRRDNWSL